MTLCALKLSEASFVSLDNRVMNEQNRVGNVFKLAPICFFMLDMYIC